MMISAGSLRLPKILHPVYKHSAQCSNTEELELRGSTLVAPRTSQSVAEQVKPGNITRPHSILVSRPTTVPRIQKHRPPSSTLNPNQLMDVVSDKLKGNGFFIMRNTFNAFDPDNKGTVTREALYRILCNLLGGISQYQYQRLLEKIRLADKKVISFNEFYSRFRVIPSREPHWLDRVTHHGPRYISAEYVHSMLVARAKQCVHNLSDFLPKWKGLQGQLDVADFRNILNSLSLGLNNEQYKKLWSKYDPGAKGYVSGEELLSKLGVKTLEQATNKGVVMRGKGINSKEDGAGKTNGDSPVPSVTLETTLSDKINSLHNEFIKKDTTSSGKVNGDAVHGCLQHIGILITRDQCYHMLNRLGYNPERPINYNSLIKTLSTHSIIGLTHAVLTDTTQRFRASSPRHACVSTPDAEATLVCKLHNDLLKLVSKLKAHDPKGTGLISKDIFINIVKGFLPEDSLGSLESLIVNKLLADDEVEQEREGGEQLVMYTKFMSLFDKMTKPAVKQLQLKEEGSLAAGEERGESSNKTDTNIKEVRDKLIKYCRTAPGTVMNAYEILDPKNTNRISQELFQQIMFRLGLSADGDVTNALWSEVLKNKDGTIHPHELIRHFDKRQNKQTDVTPVWLRGDDSHYVRSKYLDRDIDIVMKSLNTMLSLYQKPIRSYFICNDPSGTGLVTSEIFQQLVLSLCPQLSQEELLHITKKFQDSANMINYTALLKGLPSIQPVYKTGNDLATLLSHSPAPTVNLPFLSLPITSPPQHGLPGVKVKLQRKLLEKWSEFKRNLVKMDPLGTGHVNVKEFRQILSNFNISLSREDMYYILQELDPLLTGKINYAMFLQLLLGRQ
ncbi:PREDICTED: EF-hand calcium-binding domain-containing protein 6-like [Amphimedon queenslandica]|uniref:EF-hand domain-containing protein n=1 Tax=Amphimedon queenslandica TaxID=400682 RepID=A0A1X7UQU9_AMPQE|nr:PREDICTED: EF-hand calcium-binding domain-containing protein 6-like [Amphimedon queenslandica]|eukprot:XP_019852995.1 PREDICTED: EF-hand calcium-binding domain-containing protein 6-like [Amphimedon queenslandica]